MRAAKVVYDRVSVKSIFSSCAEASTKKNPQTWISRLLFHSPSSIPAKYKIVALLYPHNYIVDGILESACPASVRPLRTSFFVVSAFLLLL